LPAGAFSFTPEASVARWSASFSTKDRHCRLVPPKHPPNFAGAPTSLPYGDKAFVVSTLPSFAGTPPARQPCLPRPFDHCAHSRMPRFLRGFSDLPHSLFGSATEAIATSRSRRLESGSARIPVSMLAIIVPNLAKPQPRNFYGLF
jgi:hypothetical protein